VQPNRATVDLGNIARLRTPTGDQSFALLKFPVPPNQVLVVILVSSRFGYERFSLAGIAYFVLSSLAPDQFQERIILAEAHAIAQPTLQARR
jgi:hypothetical protein